MWRGYRKAPPLVIIDPMNPAWDSMRLRGELEDLLPGAGSVEIVDHGNSLEIRWGVSDTDGG